MNMTTPKQPDPPPAAGRAKITRQRQNARAAAPRAPVAPSIEAPGTEDLRDDPALESPDAIRSLKLIERRLLNPYQNDDVPVLIREKGFELRWFNGAQDGRLYKAVHALGWRPVHVRELIEKSQIVDLVESPEGHVTRGEKGREMLMKFPTDAFRQLQRRKVSIRESGDLHRKDAKEQTHMLAEATSERFGGQAGDAVAKFRGTTGSHRIVEDLDH